MKKYIPAKVKLVLIRTYNFFKRLFVYNNYDSSEYWKKRASEPGQAAVLWQNQSYNQLYRIEQKKIISNIIEQTGPSGNKVLDIGCGVGIVSKMLLEIKNDYQIDAVDFEEMIKVAKNTVDSTNVNFIESSAEKFLTDKKYDVILSSGCYSAIRDISKLETALDNASKMIEDDGIILMIDPFHKSNLLARAKYSSKDVINFFKSRNIEIIHKSGVLYWPYRMKLANADITFEETQKKFIRGEKKLSFRGKHKWADYKVLVFRLQK